MWDSCRSGHNIVHESVQDHSLHKENVEFEKYTNMCRSGHKIAVRMYKIEMLSPDYCNRRTFSRNVLFTYVCIKWHNQAHGAMSVHSYSIKHKLQCILTYFYHWNYSQIQFQSTWFFSVVACPQFQQEQCVRVDIF